jgi:hypothetical protein
MHTIFVDFWSSEGKGQMTSTVETISLVSKFSFKRSDEVARPDVSAFRRVSKVADGLTAESRKANLQPWGKHSLQQNTVFCVIKPVVVIYRLAELDHGSPVKSCCAGRATRFM